MPTSVSSLPLEDLGRVRGGYAGPDAVSDRPGPGILRALQSRDVADDGTIAWGALAYSRPVRDGQRYVVSEGDVLVPLRSIRTRALVARGVLPGVIAAGQWALITPHTDVVDPDYLAWFLNHPATAARLARVTKGGTLPFLSLAAIRTFEVAVPPIDVQRRIAQLGALHSRITGLERRISDARSRLVDAATMNALLQPTAFTDVTHS